MSSGDSVAPFGNNASSLNRKPAARKAPPPSFKAPPPSSGDSVSPFGASASNPHLPQSSLKAPPVASMPQPKKKKKAQPWSGPGSETNNNNAAAAAAGGSPSVSKGTTGKGSKNARKPRHVRRRQRFRQGMWNAGHGMGALDEENEDDLLSRIDHQNRANAGEDDGSDEESHMERTMAMTQATGDDRTVFQKGEGTILRSRWCQCLLLIILLGVAGIAAVFLIFGGFDGLAGGGGGGSSEDVAMEGGGAEEMEEEINLDPRLEWEFDTAILLDEKLSPLQDLLPDFTLQAVEEDVDSPQARALTWVENHPALDTMPTWKKLQLFALVSFYYAFNGDEWPDEKKINWLDYQVDECDWGDAGIEGQYLGVSCTEEQQDNIVNGTDSTRRFTDLNLDWFTGFGNVGFRNATDNEMPPEVVFLTELKTLGLMNCGVPAVLERLIPPTLRQMSNLKRLSFRFNSITGTIPTYLGLFTQLEFLNLGSNFINGTLPSQLGGLTNLRDLGLQSNKLDGSIPYNWNKLSKLTQFQAIKNQLTGSIPNFVGDWKHLEEFSIDHNDLTGTLPPTVCSLENISYVMVPCGVDCGENCEVCSDDCKR